MNSVATIVLAFSMSMDAFAAALGKGAVLRRPPLIEALRTGFIFGIVEAVTPLIGWLAGSFAAAWITQIDHWLAFLILGWLGTNMALGALRRGGNEPVSSRHSVNRLLLTAIGTSIDAMAVGVTLAFIEVDIWTACAAIGLATFIMAATGTMIGRWTGPLLGKSAEMLGGLCLIAIGSKILIEHLSTG
jgi:putative Mn2+ efflux pump MntP